MKKFTSLLMTMVLAFSLAACSPSNNVSSGADNNAAQTSKSEVTFKPGTYEEEARGYAGNIKIALTVDEHKITDLKILENSETEGLGKVAIDDLTKLIIEQQIVPVDAVSGATESTTNFLNAVGQAVTKAGGDLKALQDKTKEYYEKAKAEEKLEVAEADIIVVGAGGAGMSAAISAVENGAKSVIVVEKMPLVGGNSTRATGGMNAAATKVQEKLGISDTVEQFVEDTMKGGHQKNNKELVQNLAERSSSAIDWINGMGANLNEVGLAGGATNKRIHRPVGGGAVGPVVVNVLKDKIDQTKEITLNLNLEAKDLITNEEGQVCGVKVVSKLGNEFELRSKAVVIATGGFAGDMNMVVKYRPEYKDFDTTNGPQSSGQGILMAEAVGADTVDMEQIQIHPTVAVNSGGALITEGVRGDGAILVNRAGERFINEMQTRDVVSAAILEQEGKSAFLVFDDNVRDGLKAIEKYVQKGYAKAGTLDELSQQFNINADALKATIEKYNSFQAANDDKDFGRKIMQTPLNKGSYYVIEVKPGLHHTMGGLRINTNAEVLNKDGVAIKGLYAAGEVTGGVHGANRLGGNAVADIVIYGRTAGEMAAKSLE